MSRGRSSRSNLAETCHAMLVSTDGMSKSRHQQLLQSLPVNFCGPMVYSNKLLDIGGSWFQPHCDFDWFSTSTCHMASVSRGNPSSTQRLHCRAMSFTDLVMQGIQNTHSSTGMHVYESTCEVYIDWHRIQWLHWAGPCRRNIVKWLSSWSCKKPS